ncbi:nuclear transport factor 2 family protein [Hyphococcus sp.]|jgi:ketosteroid isomerase-like protein|uniref:nuclear transport factor 2 family protein n=1 Tax=Hyphococcus sp. TaxID=2038636 RepID=UPI003D0DC0BD
MKKFIIACAGLFLIAAHAHAEELNSADAVSLAEDYLAAYSTFDVEKMAPFLSDDMVFADPTSTEESADGGAFMFNGKEAVLKGLGDYAAQYQSFSVNYDVERQYESNGVVVFVAQLTYNLVTKDDKTFTGAAPIVTAVTVKDGKVVKHLDLYDYAGNAETFTD